MPSFSRHSGFAAALMFLSACGVAVEQAPQTASPRTVTDKTITETASAPEIPTSTETEISAAQAGNSADNSAPDIAQAEGQTIDDIIASLEAPDDDTSPVGDLFAGQGTDPDKAVSGDAENTDAADADAADADRLVKRIAGFRAPKPSLHFLRRLSPMLHAGPHRKRLNSRRRTIPAGLPLPATRPATRQRMLSGISKPPRRNGLLRQKLWHQQARTHHWQVMRLRRRLP